MSLIAVITTLPERQQAVDLSRHLVERRLVACAQMEAIESLYLWEGQLQQDLEIRLTLKTEERHFEAIQAAILSLHPYAIPALHAVRLDRVHGGFADWIRATTSDSTPIRMPEAP
ncbi:MAG: divalent-cation tolerance protein CutA [Cyanobium sp.]